ncbi:MAG TPA: GNAT family N-acetyltransferase [Planctomycetota bacterium]|nr:GNAT family N-acetyltransferase [Planctomycetota bacterium]
MKFTFRFAERRDLPRIVEIYNASIPARLATGDLEPVSVESREAWFNAHRRDKYPLLLAQNGDGKILGWGSLNAFYGRASYRFTAEISIYVAPESSRAGVGGALADELLRRCPELEIKSVLAFIFGHNEPSLHLFRKRGFTLWGKLPRIADLDGIERDLDIYGIRIGP